MKIFRRFVGWVAWSKTQHKNTDTLEMLGCFVPKGYANILQPNLPKKISIPDRWCVTLRDNIPYEIQI